MNFNIKILTNQKILHDILKVLCRFIHVYWNVFPDGIYENGMWLRS